MNHTVQYVDSGHFQGVFVAPGLALAPSHAYETLTTDNLCQCRVACLALSLCVAVSGQQEDGRVNCLLATNGPLTTQLVPDPDAVYYFWNNSIPGQYYGLKADLLMYVELTEHLNFSAAKAACARIPGHRLGIYKTQQQVSILLQLFELTGGDVYLDMHKTASGRRLWGDGSPCNIHKFLDVKDDSGDTAVYRLEKKDQINDIGSNREFRVLCQVNPLGYHW